MLQFGNVVVNSQHEPPRPTIRPFWRALEESRTLEGGEEEIGSELEYESISVSAQQAVPGSPGTLDREADLLHNVGEKPVLSDYTNRCEPDEDGCEGRTFETMDSGVLRWTENAGNPNSENFTTIEHSITKAGGQVQSISAVKSAIRAIYTPFWARQADYRVYPIEWHTVNNYYSACCPQALERSVETTYVNWSAQVFHPKSIHELMDTETIIDQDMVYMHSEKTVQQRWQAEGWLRHRMTTSTEVAYWTYYAYRQEGGVGIHPRISQRPAYKTSSRSETYTPIGGGKWLIYVVESNLIFLPVTTFFATREEVLTTEYASHSNSYVIETDQAPPTVSCDSDPDNPEETCEQKAGREYQEALDEYNQRVAIYDASIFNAPPATMRQSLTTSRRMRVGMGEMLTGPSGAGVVVDVNYSGNRPLGNVPEDRVSFTLLSRLN